MEVLRGDLRHHCRCVDALLCGGSCLCCSNRRCSGELQARMMVVAAARWTEMVANLGFMFGKKMMMTWHYFIG
ncbi:hypothetical protein DEO72_LG10g2510 [Vigna unguiculata]|uniref:Uncharacterized protein n=1 Tax=Vigna unguiculata TaxID=3917 RepID=A0A4D6NH71_VIGUN|nr:hypothetical protein DEO72_LG10g2510 [Vigna unguiculata]